MAEQVIVCLLKMCISFGGWGQASQSFIFLEADPHDLFFFYAVNFCRPNASMQIGAFLRHYISFH